MNAERLKLHNVTMSDAGWYTCVVNNRYGQIQQSAWIEVLTEESVGRAPSDNYSLFVALTIALGVCAAIVTIAICWQRRRPPKRRPLVLKENSLYFEPFNLPVDPQWEINRIQ